MDATDIPALHIHMFGPFTVHINGRPLPPVQRSKAIPLLAYLVIRAGSPVRRSEIAADLWPNAEGGLELERLKKCLAELRNALGEEAHRITAPGPGLLLFEIDGAEIDLVRFRRQARSDSAEELEAAVALRDRALLEGWGDDDGEEWVLGERETVERQFAGALRRLIGGARNSGEAAACLRYLRMAAEIGRLDEIDWLPAIRLLAQQRGPGAAADALCDLQRRLARAGRRLSEAAMRLLREFAGENRGSAARFEDSDLWRTVASSLRSGAAPHVLFEGVVRRWFAAGQTAAARERLLDLLGTPGAVHPGVHSDVNTLIARLTLEMGDAAGAKAHAEQALAQARAQSKPAGISRSVCWLSFIETVRRDYERALSLAQERLEIARQIGPRHEVAIALRELGEVRFWQRDLEAAARLYLQAQQILLELGEDRHAIVTGACVGHAFLEQGDCSRARKAISSALAMAEADNYADLLTDFLPYLGECDLRRGKPALARAAYLRSLRTAVDLRDARAVLRSLWWLPRLESAAGRPERVAWLWGAIQALRADQGLRASFDSDQSMIGDSVERARAALGDSQFDLMWQSGRCTQPGEIADHVLTRFAR